MSDFLSRLRLEKQELSEKVESLQKFIDSDAFKTIGNVQQTLLNIQINAMITYKQCLLERLVRLEVEE